MTFAGFTALSDEIRTKLGQAFSSAISSKLSKANTLFFTAS